MEFFAETCSGVVKSVFVQYASLGYTLVTEGDIDKNGVDEDGNRSRIILGNRNKCSRPQ